MKRFAVFFVLLIGIIAWWLWRGRPLPIERTVIARVPPDFSSLLVADLDGDKRPELVVTFREAHRVMTPSGWHFLYQPALLIRSPLTNPKVIKLPYACPLESSCQAPLRKLPTPEGWLRLRGDEPVLEPFVSPDEGKAVGQASIINLDTDGYKDDVIVTVRKGKSKERWWFKVNADGQWRLVWKRRDLPPAYGNQFGDLNGDGFFEAISHLPRRNAMVIRWGDAELTTEVPAPFYPCLITDLDGDRCDELVTVERTPSDFRLAFWKAEPKTRRIRRTAISPAVPYSAKSSFLHWRLEAVKKMGKRFAFMVTGIEYPFGFPMCGLGSPPPRNIIASTIFLWDGKKWQVMKATTEPNREPLLHSAFMLNGERYLVMTVHVTRRCFTPRLLSWKPLRIEWWQMEQRSYGEIWKAPDGGALNLFQGRVVERLPAMPILVGDWDSDGRVEMVLKEAIFQSPRFNLPYRPTRLFLAQFDGRRLRWAGWSQDGELIRKRRSVLPHPQPLRILAIKGGKKSAVIVAWSNGVIERVRWVKD